MNVRKLATIFFVGKLNDAYFTEKYFKTLFSVAKSYMACLRWGGVFKYDFITSLTMKEF